MSVELLKSICDWLTVVLIALTVASGAGALITGDIISKRQEARLRKFDGDLTDAKIELGRQQILASDAAARVAGLEQDAANAKARAATAERSLLELQQRLTHRRISKADQDKMVALLSPFPGSVVRFTKLGDSEAKQFADDLLAVFQAAKWSVQLSIVGTLSPPRYGLACMVDESSSAGKALAKALSGLPTVSMAPVKLKGSVAEILAGLKPPA
jgi:hypothetical protein